MAKKITVSDTNAKQKCIEYLKELGYNNLAVAKRSDNCDIIGYKDNLKFYFEVKFSSKKDGKFFGTVMLTEIYHAINNKSFYRFIVCRGESSAKEDWFFKIFEVNDFIKFCTLTTPILHYHIYFDKDGKITIPNFVEKTVVANEKLILNMWENFSDWKNKNI